MNLFIKKISFFLTIPIILFILMFVVINYYNNNLLKSNKIAPNIKSIVIGDSHIRLAVDDKLLHNTLNISQNSESFYFSFYKLKAILTTNNNIQKVYLGFSYHSLSTYYDEFVFGKHSNTNSVKYFFTLPSNEKIQLIKWNYDKLASYLLHVFAAGFRNLISSNNPAYLGSYKNVFNHVFASKKFMDKRLVFQFYKNNRLNDFSKSNIKYLKKIIDLCKEENVELIFLNTPLHPYYKRKIPSKYIARFNEIISQSHLLTIDFNEVNLTDSCFIPDGDHVSTKGALLVTKYLFENNRKNY